jgi:hypothetical protein
MIPNCRSGSRMTLSDTENQQTKGSYQPSVGLIIGSIVAVMAWLVFILIYALDWSKGYSLFQNLIVTVVSFAIVGLVIGALWLAFTPRKYWSGRY